MTWMSPATAGFFETSDNVLSETYGPTYKQVNIPTNRNNHGTDVGIFRTNLQHTDTWKYGGNILNFGFQKSNGHDPMRGTKSTGATQWYGSALSYFSGNRLFNTRLFAFGPVKDLRMDVGFNLNDKNSNLQNKKKQIVVGPSVSFDVPGTLTIGFHLIKEWNYNGIVHKNVNYDPAFELAVYALQPLRFTGLPLRWQNIASLETAKGKDGFGKQTADTVFANTSLILDVGELMFNRPRRLDGFVGFQYWYNKTGDDHRLKSGAIEETAFFGFGLHF